MNSPLLIGLAALVFGVLIGILVQQARSAQKKRNEDADIAKTIKKAQEDASQLLLSAQQQAVAVQEASKKEERERREILNDAEKRIAKKEEQFEEKLQRVEREKDELAAKATELEAERERMKLVEQEQVAVLEKLSGLSRDVARDELMSRVEAEAQDDVLKRLATVEERYKEEAEDKAKNILTHAIQKYAGDVVSDSTMTIVPLPNDDMKGRIIGREGRNIMTFEKITGCDVIVDESPGSIVVSGFDLVRRYVAKLAMEKLIVDGRIHPTRIEEAVEQARKEVGKQIKDFGEKALFDTGIAGLHPDLVKILGRLRFRTSYGQNVLKHSIEVAFLASAIAEELGADLNIVKKGGLLHDIGKAVDHEIAGPHALIGRDIAKKFGINEPVIHAIEAHHEDVAPRTIEALIVQTADAISASRPGARRESLETYIRRLEELEATANGFEGVEKTYAIQAGREIRVFVRPDVVNDLQAAKLAREIADKIEQNLEYPGQIKVNVIRESRVTVYAK